MKKRMIWITLLIFLTGTLTAEQKKKKGGRGYPPEMPGAEKEIYKTIGDVTMNIYLYYPKGHTSKDKRAAIVFFFGGGWKGGSPGQFQKQSEYLASRGMIAACADYRVLSRHKTKATACVEDGKSAVRWLRINAKRLGIDPSRIAAGGGSAGGHIAACTGTIKGFEAKNENIKISSVPDAMVLFNPACVLAPVEGVSPLNPDRVEGLEERMGTKLENLSPYHHVKKGTPSTIIFHGKADTTVPYKTAELFTKKMKQVGNRCELVGFDDMPHGFFNHGKYENKPYEETIKKMDAFLVSLGFLEKRP